MQESDAIQIVCSMVLEYSGDCVLHGPNKFWNYCGTMTNRITNTNENITILALRTRWVIIQTGFYELKLFLKSSTFE